MSAGGLAWRLGAYLGGWQTPAPAYREWLTQSFAPTEPPEWVSQLRLAVSWCPTDTAILEAIRDRIDPERVLLHVPDWRTDPYDENYPTYEVSDAGRGFISRANAMGFHTMPHFNSIDMDPTHPRYADVREFQYRDIETMAVQGWTWFNGAGLPVPESNAARLRHRDKKTMIKVHPGLANWRSILSEAVRNASQELDLETVFLDVTLCTWNLHNCLVENQTPTEGMKRLIATVASIDGGLVVGGEGRNEITMQDEGLAQVHLFRSWHRSIEGLARAASCPVNEFLFGQWCRSFGYSGLSGRNDEEVERMRAHLALGAIPTITIRSADEIARPNSAVAEMLDRAAE